MSQSVWTTVVEQLADTDRYEVLAPTMVGHNAGPAAGTLFLDTRTLADHVETQLDELGWGSAHIVGNSLGGWVAFELERRGRARTITDIAPAGRVDALLTGQVRGGAEVCARGTAVGGRLPARPAGC